MSRKSLVIVFIVVFVCSLFISTTVFSRVFPDPKQSDKKISAISPTLEPTIIPTPDPLAPIQVLLLGYGGGLHDGGSLTDTIILAKISPKLKLIQLVSIPRDTWVPLPITEQGPIEYKINAAYAIGVDQKNYPAKPAEYQGRDGGLKLASQAIQTLTGLPAQYSVAISFDGFLKAFQLLEPLSVTVPYTFTDNFYPVAGKELEVCDLSEENVKAITATMSGFELEKQFPCRYESITFTRGKQTMDATTALKFVRSRHSDVGGGDFNRSKRQLALLEAVKQKITQPAILTKLLPLVQQLSQSIDTSISLTDLPQLIGRYNDITNYKIMTITISEDNIMTTGTGPRGEYILVPKPGVTIKDYLAIELTNQATSSALPTTATASTSATTR